MSAQANAERDHLIVIGEAARSFVNSPLGQAVLSLAHQDRDAALGKLMDADASNALLIQRLQQDAKRAGDIHAYLAELIQRAENELQAAQETPDATGA